jgi:mannose-6-phosphate isomerase-like protein (cupin superfamily)
MKVQSALKVRKKFNVLIGSRDVQVARMTLPPGAKSDDEISNEHPESEQWLFVLSGSGRVVTVKGGRRRSVKIRKGSLLLIEKRELHQVTNTGRSPLDTLNFYSPPAYDKAGGLIRKR